MIKKRNILISVYITNYNYGKYLEQSIKSVLNQTTKDFELIIIDDGSTDNSLEIIKKFENKPQIKFIKQKNKGLNVSNNIALKLSKGKYIIRLDADDWLEKNALELLSNHLEKHPDIGLVFADYYHVNNSGQIIEEVRRHNFDDVTLLDKPAHGACTMIRTSCLKNIGGYDESFKCQDGFDLWIRFIKSFKVSNINKTLFFYRQHQNNLTKQEGRILSTRAKILNKAAKNKNKKITVIAIISVRGETFDNSCLSLKRLKNKYLIDWTIEAALGTNKIDKVVVDTPDEKIFKYIESKKQKNLSCILRDESLANLNTSILYSIKNALEQTEEKEKKTYDAVFQLTIESPFRNKEHLDCAINVMNVFETDVVIGVREENDNFYQHSGHGLKLIKESTELRLEREDLFREVGSMRLIKRKILKKIPITKSLKIGHVNLDEKSSMRISSNFMWDLVKSIAEKDS